MSENVVTREFAISRLRLRLLDMLSRGESICHLAGENRILCGGFRRYTDEELRSTYSRLLRRDPFMSRAALERAANDAQLARQAELGVVLSCDAQRACYETCRGWDDFTNAQLATFCRELLGEEVSVGGELMMAAL
jgi:hypothetical protein